MTRSTRLASVAFLTLVALFACGSALAACEQRDFACEAKTVCVRSVSGGADWFPRPPRPFVPGPRPPRPPLA